MRGHKQPPETDREYYKRRLSEIGRKVFEVTASALFFYFVDRVIHTLLNALHIPSVTAPGKYVHNTLSWLVGGTYLVYIVRLLLPDANEQIAEMRDQIVHFWKKPRTRRKKLP